MAVAVCSLKAVACRTLAVEAPGRVNTAKHTACYSCRQQALIHIWKDGEPWRKNTLFIDINDINRHRYINTHSHTHTHTCAGDLVVSWLIAVITAAHKGTKSVDASLLTLVLPLRTLI